jgi:CBS domain-containing protein
MAADPITLVDDGDLGEALDLMRSHRISALYIVAGDSGKAVGMVHLQDLLRIGVLW